MLGDFKLHFIPHNWRLGAIHTFNQQPHEIYDFVPLILTGNKVLGATIYRSG